MNSESTEKVLELRAVVRIFRQNYWTDVLYGSPSLLEGVRLCLQ